MKPYEKLLRFWAETGAAISGEPATPSEIAALENQFGVRLPEDFRDYLLKAVPRLGESWDENLTTWWDVSRIASEQDEHCQKSMADGATDNPHRYLIFADYMFWCWGWAIACGDTEQRGKIIVLSNPDRVVANDFATFVDLNINMANTGDSVLA